MISLFIVLPNTIQCRIALKEAEPSLSFELANGFMIVEAHVDGEAGSYVLDTGTPNLIINGKVKDTSVELVGVDNEIDAGEMVVNQFQFGSVEKENIRAWVVDLNFLESIVNRKVKGIIGADIISDFAIFIDFKNKRLQLVKSAYEAEFKPSKNHYIIPCKFIESENKFPVIETKIGKKNFRFGVDTGANICVLDQKLKNSNQYKSRHISDSGNNFLELEELVIRNARLKDVAYIYKDLNELNKHIEIPIDGILSLDMLNLDQVIIDYLNSKIIFFWNNSNKT
ncbi:MAG: pepsin/retropepsin-like aspartic protease family protein [Melioribacteraceae bacterium]|nr:pepsin/retropepsin-like aspartic protease family protein [Melioribacteraceae bacterium]